MNSSAYGEWTVNIHCVECGDDSSSFGNLCVEDGVVITVSEKSAPNEAGKSTINAGITVTMSIRTTER